MQRIQNSARKVKLIIFFIALLNLPNANAQWTFPSPTTGAPCWGCVPAGWIMEFGSTDISSLDDWISYPHYDMDGVVAPVPEPTPGVTSFMSAMSSEKSSTSFTLADPEVLTVYFGGFGTSSSGTGPAGAEQGMTINLLVNGTSVDIPIPWDGQWHAVTYDLVAGVNTIEFEPGIGDDENRHACHISIPAEQPGTCDNLAAEPFDSDLCIGDDLILDVTSENGGTITWDGGVVNGEVFTPPTGTTTYIATSDSEDDCDFTAVITVHELPDVTATVDDENICLGESVTFNGGGAETYEWDNGVTDDVLFEPLDGGTVTYTVTGTDEFGCVNTASIDVTVFDPPTTDFEFIVDGVSSEDGGIGGCYLSTVQFNDLSVAAGMDEIESWIWTFGDGDSSTDENPEHTYDVSGTYTVTLTITTEQGCTGTFTLDIIMFDQPALELTYNNPTCFGYSDGSVTVSVIGGGGDGLTFEITDSDGTILNIANSNTANELNTGWYYIDVSDVSACSATDSVFLTEPGEIDIDLTTFDVECYDFKTGWAEVVDVINYTGSYDGISYFWNPNPNGIDGLGANTSTDLGAGNYTVTINDENGCSNIFDFEILEPTELVVDIDFNPALCRTFGYQNGNGVVYGTAEGGTPDYDYLWTNLDNGDEYINTTVGGLNPGNFEFTVTDGNGCVTVGTVFLDSINPVAAFTVNSAQLNADCQGTADVVVEFINESYDFALEDDPTSDTTFFWNLNSPNNSYEITHSYEYRPDTTYFAEGQTYQIEVCLIAFNKNDCQDEACKIITVYEPIKFTHVNVFSPNGDGKNDVFTFEFMSASISQFECVIVNRWGVVIHEMTSITDEWDGTDRNGDQVKDGTYFYTYVALTDDNTELKGQGTVNKVGGK